MKRTHSIKVSLSEGAAEDLDNIAHSLGITKAEVLRKGLSIMQHYALKKEEDKTEPSLILERRGGKREILVLTK